MASDLNDTGFLSTIIIGAIAIPGEPECVRIEPAIGCDGFVCHEARASYADDVDYVPATPHSHLVVDTSTGVPEVLAVFK